MWPFRRRPPRVVSPDSGADSGSAEQRTGSTAPPLSAPPSARDAWRAAAPLDPSVQRMTTVVDAAGFSRGLATQQRGHLWVGALGHHVTPLAPAGRFDALAVPGPPVQRASSEELVLPPPPPAGPAEGAGGVSAGVPDVGPTVVARRAAPVGAPAARAVALTAAPAPDLPLVALGAVPEAHGDGAPVAAPSGAEPAAALLGGTAPAPVEPEAATPPAGPVPAAELPLVLPAPAVQRSRGDGAAGPGAAVRRPSLRTGSEPVSPSSTAAATAAGTPPSGAVPGWGPLDPAPPVAPTESAPPARRLGLGAPLRPGDGPPVHRAVAPEPAPARPAGLGLPLNLGGPTIPEPARTAGRHPTPTAPARSATPGPADADGAPVQRSARSDHSEAVAGSPDWHGDVAADEVTPEAPAAPATFHPSDGSSGEGGSDAPLVGVHLARPSDPAPTSAPEDTVPEVGLPLATPAAPLQRATDRGDTSAAGAADLRAADGHGAGPGTPAPPVVPTLRALPEAAPPPLSELPPPASPAAEPPLVARRADGDRHAPTLGVPVDHYDWGSAAPALAVQPSGGDAGPTTSTETTARGADLPLAGPPDGGPIQRTVAPTSTPSQPARPGDPAMTGDAGQSGGDSPVQRAAATSATSATGHATLLGDVRRPTLASRPGDAGRPGKAGQPPDNRSLLALAVPPPPQTAPSHAPPSSGTPAAGAVAHVAGAADAPLLGLRAADATPGPAASGAGHADGQLGPLGPADRLDGSHAVQRRTDDLPLTIGGRPRPTPGVAPLLGGGASVIGPPGRPGRPAESGGPPSAVSPSPLAAVPTVSRALAGADAGRAPAAPVGPGPGPGHAGTRGVVAARWSASTPETDGGTWGALALASPSPGPAVHVARTVAPSTAAGSGRPERAGEWERSADMSSQRSSPQGLPAALGGPAPLAGQAAPERPAAPGRAGPPDDLAAPAPAPLPLAVVHRAAASVQRRTSTQGRGLPLVHPPAPLPHEAPDPPPAMGTVDPLQRALREGAAHRDSSGAVVFRRIEDPIATPAAEPPASGSADDAPAPALDVSALGGDALDLLARRLYPRISRRVKAELRTDRDRYGLGAGPRR